LKITN